MIYTEKEITLKDGRPAKLRNPRTDDAAQLLSFMRQASGETDFLAHYPEEVDTSDIAGEIDWVSIQLFTPNTLDIVCVVDGEIVGNCDIRFKKAMKTSHRAVVSIAILQDYWGLGIGSAMFNELIAAAKERGTEIMELEFIEGNDRAKRLYEKFGFKVISEIPYAIKLKDGTSLSEFYMQMRLN